MGTPLSAASCRIKASPFSDVRYTAVATAATFTIIFYETVSPATTGGTTFETDV